MASKEARERRMKEIQEIAAGWGKIIAREAFPDGPGLEVTLVDLAAILGVGQRLLARASGRRDRGATAMAIATRAAAGRSGDAGQRSPPNRPCHGPILDQQPQPNGLLSLSTVGIARDRFSGGVAAETSQQACEGDGEVLERRAFR